MLATDSPYESGKRNPSDATRLIVETIIEAISSRRLPPGAKLGENQLAQAFNVSRTIVRQSLQELAFTGVVQAITNRGAFIAQFSPQEAADLYAARRVIETETVLQLARYCTAGDIRQLRRHVGWEREFEATGNLLELTRLRSDFHLLIARLAGNKVLADILERLLPQTALIRAFYGSAQPQKHPTDDHDRLIDLLASGDEQACVELIREHLHLDERRLVIPTPSDIPSFDIAKALRNVREGRPAGAEASRRKPTTTKTRAKRSTARG